MKIDKREISGSTFSPFEIAIEIKDYEEFYSLLEELRDVDTGEGEVLEEMYDVLFDMLGVHKEGITLYKQMTTGPIRIEREKEFKFEIPFQPIVIAIPITEYRKLKTLFQDLEEVKEDFEIKGTLKMLYDFVKKMYDEYAPANELPANEPKKKKRLYEKKKGYRRNISKREIKKNICVST